MVTAAQIRMARAALRIGVRDLAEMADVNAGTISRFETEKGGMHADTRDRVQATLEREGVTFEPDNGQGPGVRFRSAIGEG